VLGLNCLMNDSVQTSDREQMLVKFSNVNECESRSMTETQSEKKFEHGDQDVVVGWGWRQVHVVA